MNSDDLFGGVPEIDLLAVFGGRFAIEREAGIGGMGIVYRAVDRENGQRVALKVLRGTDPTAIRRFAAEADALEKLDHPAIVHYVGHGISEEDEPYLAMEWIEGESLNVHLARISAERKSLEVGDVLELAQRMADALDAAHANGIVHRDVKPSNILLPAGRLQDAKLADFGIVRADSASHLTTTGIILGTIGYMAPEQARGEENIDGRADLFSLGCVLFRCLTNTEVFEGSTAVTVLANLMLREPPRVSTLRPDVPAALDDLIAGLLAKDPNERPESAASVKRALEHIAARPGDAAPATAGRRPRLWVAGAVAVLGAAALVHGLARQPSPEAATTASAPPSPSASGTAITGLPISPACTPAAVAAYREGLQEIREAAWVRAHQAFEKGAEADPACPQLQLRLVLTGEWRYTLAREREQLRKASSMRDALSERDRLLLDAWTDVMASDTPREENAVRTLETAVARFPRDAELLVLTTMRMLNLASYREKPEALLEMSRRATEIDPGYADAWQLQGIILGQLGRTDEQLAATSRCLEVAPGSVDCLEDRIRALRLQGRCGEAVNGARRKIAWAPTDPWSYWELAVNLAAQGAARETVEEALALRQSHSRAEERALVGLAQRGKFMAWTGDFDEALHAARELDRRAGDSSALDYYLSGAIVAVDTLHELGRDAEAAGEAERFLQREKAWVLGDRSIIGAAHYEPRFFAAELDGKKITPLQWRETSDAWEQANRTRMNGFERWVVRWGTAAGSRIDAAEAMGHAPTADVRNAMRSPNLALQIGVSEAYEGRLLLQSGDAQRAAPLLETAAHACQSLDFPFLNVRSHLWLGQAKEKLGDIAGACEAYRAVVDRWGASKRPSVTAREAKDRRTALACR